MIVFRLEKWFVYSFCCFKRRFNEFNVKACTLSETTHLTRQAMTEEVSEWSLESYVNPMMGLHGWGLAAVSIQDAGCSVSALRGLSCCPRSMLCLLPWRECFCWKDNRPQKANSLIPDPSQQTVWDTT